MHITILVAKEKLFHCYGSAEKKTSSPIHTPSPDSFTPEKKKHNNNIITPKKLFQKKLDDFCSNISTSRVENDNEVSINDIGLNDINADKNDRKIVDDIPTLLTSEYSYTAEQTLIINDCLSGKNVFYSGGAGSGMYAFIYMYIHL